MDEFDNCICPTRMTTGIPAEFTWPESEIKINGILKNRAEEFWNSTFLFNMLSRCSVVSIPNGLATNGPPTASQIVACSYDYQRVINAVNVLQGSEGL